MEPITINNLTFAYPGQEPLFNHCDLNISSDWKLGLHDYTLNVLMRGGYQGEQWQIERELNLMATPTELLWQPFSSLSGGEQTHVMLATLFAQDGYFPLLDEPTNHLDQDGRKQIAQYLKAKKKRLHYH